MNALAETERRLEARSRQVPVLPQVPEFRVWRLALRDEAASALGYPSEGSRWIVEAEEYDYDELLCSGP